MFISHKTSYARINVNIKRSIAHFMVHCTRNSLRSAISQPHIEITGLLTDVTSHVTSRMTSARKDVQYTCNILFGLF